MVALLHTDAGYISNMTDKVFLSMIFWITMINYYNLIIGSVSTWMEMKVRPVISETKLVYFWALFIRI